VWFKTFYFGDAFTWRAGDGEALEQIVRYKIRIDALFDRFRDIEIIHEALYSRRFALRNGFHGEAKIMVGAVGHARAHAAAREIAVVVDHDHAGGHDIDFRQTAGLPFRALLNAAARPVCDRSLESRAQDNAITGAAGNAQRLWPFGGDVNRHGALADF